MGETLDKASSDGVVLSVLKSSDRNQESLVAEDPVPTVTPVVMKENGVNCSFDFAKYEKRLAQCDSIIKEHLAQC